MGAEKTDVVIVGGRCAGSAMALLLARAGVDVIVVDQQEPTQDTLSTHALMRGALLLLERWGLLDDVLGTGLAAAERTVFGYGDHREVVPMEPLYAPRRTVLDPILADAAKDAGATFRYGIHVEDVLRGDDSRVVGVVGREEERGDTTIEAGLTIGADGRTSLIARRVGAESYLDGGPGAFMAYGYFAGLDVEGFHWLYRDNAMCGLIPTNDGLVLVSGSTVPARRRGDLKGQPDHGLWLLVRQVDPELADRLAEAELQEHVRAFPGVSGYLREPAGPGWALIGDAGHFKDPNTAHGITDALRDAALAAPAVLASLDGGDGQEAFASFKGQRDELAMPIFEATETICAFDWTLDELQAAHLALARAMKHETAVLGALPAPAVSAP